MPPRLLNVSVTREFRSLKVRCCSGGLGGSNDESGSLGGETHLSGGAEVSEIFFVCESWSEDDRFRGLREMCQTTRRSQKRKC